jgi:hypothetical protein
MSLGRPVSVNDEVREMPKIRKDQYRKVLEVVRTNSKFPSVALGLVRDMVKGYDNFKTVILDNEENPTKITLFLYNSYSKMHTQYEFSLIPPIILEPATL